MTGKGTLLSSDIFDFARFSIVAFVKLEAYRTSTRLNHFALMNHFALKGKLYQAALASAFEQLQQLKRLCPAATITG